MKLTHSEVSPKFCVRFPLRPCMQWPQMGTHSSHMHWYKLMLIIHVYMDDFTEPFISFYVIKFWLFSYRALHTLLIQPSECFLLATWYGSVNCLKQLSVSPDLMNIVKKGRNMKKFKWIFSSSAMSSKLEIPMLKKRQINKKKGTRIYIFISCLHTR